MTTNRFTTFNSNENKNSTTENYTDNIYFQPSQKKDVLNKQSDLLAYDYASNEHFQILIQHPELLNNAAEESYKAEKIKKYLVSQPIEEMIKKANLREMLWGYHSLDPVSLGTRGKQMELTGQ